MTPLKFRVFDPATGKMSIDITLELLCMQAPTLNESLAGLLYKGLIVMQSTGLFDKNGVEIFEGDIARHRLAGDFESKNVITGKVVIEPSRGVVIGGWPISFEVEVIGNVHENPDLLPQSA